MTNKYLVQGPILKEPIPYIQGFGLTYPQLDAVVSSVLSLQIINSYGGNILTAIRAELHEAGQDFTIVPFATGPKDNRHVRYLYIIDVLPSWNGERPRIPISQKMANTFFETFGRDEWLEELKPYCIRWPAYEPEPKWLQTRLWKSVKKLEDWAKRRMTPEEIEAAMQQQQLEVETEEELKALKTLITDAGPPAAQVGSQYTDAIVPATVNVKRERERSPPLPPNQPTSWVKREDDDSTEANTREERSNGINMAEPSAVEPCSKSEAVVDTKSAVGISGASTTLVADSMARRKGRKRTPPEAIAIQPMVRPKRACTMKGRRNR